MGLDASGTDTWSIEITSIDLDGTDTYEFQVAMTDGDGDAIAWEITSGLAVGTLSRSLASPDVEALTGSGVFNFGDIDNIEIGIDALTSSATNNPDSLRFDNFQFTTAISDPASLVLLGLGGLLLACRSA